jgi:hypothetical protein
MALVIRPAGSAWLAAVAALASWGVAAAHGQVAATTPARPPAPALIYAAYVAAARAGNVVEAQALTVPDVEAQQLAAAEAGNGAALGAFARAMTTRFGAAGQAAANLLPALPEDDLKALVEDERATVTLHGAPVAALRRVAGSWRVDPAALAPLAPTLARLGAERPAVAQITAQLGRGEFTSAPSALEALRLAVTRADVMVALQSVPDSPATLPAWVNAAARGAVEAPPPDDNDPIAVLRSWSAALRAGDTKAAAALTVPADEAQKMVPVRQKLERAQVELIAAAAQAFGQRGVAALAAVGGPTADENTPEHFTATVDDISATIRAGTTPIATLRKIRGKWRVDPRPAEGAAEKLLATQTAVADACALTTRELAAGQFADPATLAATWALRRAQALAH